MTFVMRQCLLTSVVCFSVACGAPQAPVDAPPKTDNRLDSCRDALTSTQSDLRGVVLACSQMWRRPECSQAWLESLEMTGIAGAEHIIDRCKEAYCSKPEFAICVEETAVDLTHEEVDWLWLWTDLNTVILRQDLDERVEAPEAGQFARLLLDRVIFRNPAREP